MAPAVALWIRTALPTMRSEPGWELEEWGHVVSSGEGDAGCCADGVPQELGHVVSRGGGGDGRSVGDVPCIEGEAKVLGETESTV